MTSSINPNNIDNAYPVAGQDNDSQGFRDNFTNIKTNFAYAGSEITDLQSKVLLKAALSGTSLDNDLGGSPLVGAQIQNFTAAKVDLGTTSGTVTINYAAGHYQVVSSSGSMTLAFTNIPAAGSAAMFRVRVTINSVAHTLTLPVAVNLGLAEIQGISGSTITFPTTGTFEFEFVTIDGGSSVEILDLSRNVDPMYLPSHEDLAPSGAVSLTTTTSYFTTAGSETATLAAGANGQIKMLVATDVTAGSMTVTVSNAGWKASGTGTATFSTRGASCTLLYVNAHWYCVGNNGVSFA